jgi:hypothetical protein
MSGSCPNVTIVVRNVTIVVDRSTEFSKSRCSDLRRGRDVDGEGLTQPPSASIRATEIRVDKD